MQPNEIDCKFYLIELLFYGSKVQRLFDQDITETKDL